MMLFSDRCEQLCRGFGGADAKPFPHNHVDLMTRITELFTTQALEVLGIAVRLEKRRCQYILWWDMPTRSVVFFSIGLYVGTKMKKEERAMSVECNVILTTLGEAREGVDIATLEQGMCATPFGEVEQAEGRQCRVHAHKGEIVFIDLVDTSCDSFRGMMRMHEVFFLKERGYKLKRFTDDMKWKEEGKVWNEKWI